MGRIYRRPVKQKSGLWAAWRQLFNKRIRWWGHNVICQLVSLYKEELGATAWKCHLRTQINLHTCCFGCEGSVTLHQSGTILCKSELPLQTADKPVLRRPQRLFKVEKKKIKAWMSSKQMLAQIQSGCCRSASSRLLRGIFLLKLMLMGWTRSLVERHRQLAVYSSLLSESTFMNSMLILTISFRIRFWNLSLASNSNILQEDSLFFKP